MWRNENGMLPVFGTTIDLMGQVFQLRVCVECHTLVSPAEQYVFLPEKGSTNAAYRHTQCDDICQWIGSALKCPVPGGKMMLGWEKLRVRTLNDGWDTAPMQRLRKQMAAVLARMKERSIKSMVR
jgi:hypothetical protein